MPYFTYDTSVIISRRLVLAPRVPSNFRLSSVVLMELSASASDDSRRKVHENLFRSYQKEELLIVPNEDDWLLVTNFCTCLHKIDEEPKAESCVVSIRACLSEWRLMRSSQLARVVAML